MSRYYCCGSFTLGIQMAILLIRCKISKGHACLQEWHQRELMPSLFRVWKGVLVFWAVILVTIDLLFRVSIRSFDIAFTSSLPILSGATETTYKASISSKQLRSSITFDFKLKASPFHFALLPNPDFSIGKENGEPRGSYCPNLWYDWG